MISKFFGLFALCFLVSMVYSEKMKNIDYLSYGYNVIRGNPHTTKAGVDPGFIIESIFGLSYGQSRKSSDGRWDVPDNTTVVKEVAYNADFGTDQMTGMQNYTSSSETEFHFGLEGWGAKFSLSVDYQEIRSTTKSQRSVFTFAKAFVQVYTAKLQSYEPPNLSKNFLAGVASLPDTFDELAYMKFIESFGTHYITQVHMGARFACQSMLSESSYTSLLKQHIKVEAAAKYSAYGVSGFLDVRRKEEKEMAQKFDSLKERASINSIGAPPVKNGTPIDWVTQSIEEPMPIKYSMLPISKIFNRIYFKGILPDSKLAKLEQNMDYALKNYCGFLQKTGQIQDCGPLSPDPPLPTLLTSCRYCAKKCGQKFPLDGGRIGMNYDLYDSTLMYPEGCVGNLGHYHAQGQGIALCCEQETEERHGTCKLCNSCGGDFPNIASAMICNREKNCDNYFMGFEKGCRGENKKRTNRYMELCCKTTPVCTVCLSCGGKWPVVGAQMVPNKKEDYAGFTFIGRDHSCEGGLKEMISGEPKYLCCQNVDSAKEMAYMMHQTYLTVTELK